MFGYPREKCGATGLVIILAILKIFDNWPGNNLGNTKKYSMCFVIAGISVGYTCRTHKEGHRSIYSKRAVTWYGHLLDVGDVIPELVSQWIPTPVKSIRKYKNKIKEI